MVAEAAAASGERIKREAVHQLLGRAFLRIEREVVKTQSFDAAPGAMGDPYGRLADSALAQTRFGSALGGVERDAVIAYWMARGVVRELQAMMAEQDDRPANQRAVRDLDTREKTMMQAKDWACLRLIRPIRDELAYRPQKHTHINVDDLFLDLIREWAGVHKEGQSERLAEMHDMAPRTYRDLRSGWKGRGGRAGSPGVHGLLNRHYHRAIDRLAGAMTADDLSEV